MHQKISVTKPHTIVTTNKQTIAIANVLIKNTCNQLFDEVHDVLAIDVANDLQSDYIQCILFKCTSNKCGHYAQCSSTIVCSSFEGCQYGSGLLIL